MIHLRSDLGSVTLKFSPEAEWGLRIEFRVVGGNWLDHWLADSHCLRYPRLHPLNNDFFPILSYFLFSTFVLLSQDFIFSFLFIFAREFAYFVFYWNVPSLVCLRLIVRLLVPLGWLLFIFVSLSFCFLLLIRFFSC